MGEASARLASRSLLAMLLGGLCPVPLAAQDNDSAIGVIARLGWGPTGRFDDAYVLGVELEYRPQNVVVPSARIEFWDFGISCVAFDPCPSGVALFNVGGKYRVHSGTRLTPNIGADAGYMKWSSGAGGLNIRIRAGIDVEVIRHVDMVLDVVYGRMWEVWQTHERTLQSHVVGAAAGVRLWL